MAEYWLTTTDNPYDPFEDFDNWYQFDIGNGYNTCAIVARVALTSNELDETANSNAINEAVKTLARLNINGRYKLVSKNT